jgi:hypothetical protein
MINPEDKIGERIWIPELNKHATINGVLRLYMATEDNGRFYHMVCSHVDPNWKELSKRQEYCLKMMCKFQSDFFRGLIIFKNKNDDKNL